MHPALDLIVSGAEAWTSAEALASAGHGPAELAALEAAGLAEPWGLPGGDAWTLTPLAAYLLGVCLDGPLRWAPRPLDVTLRRRPCHVHCAPGQCRLRLPELVPDRAPGPEYLIDPVSEAPIRLLPQLFDSGKPVIIDKRLRGKGGSRRAG